MTYGSGYSSIRQMQIGVTLDVTPSVMPDGSVVMDILQKLDSFEGSVGIQNVGDVTSTKYSEARAKTVVGNRETFLLGGLIETVKTSTRSGVPLLKDIPLLASLFGRSSVRTTSNELLVLIRPTVLPQKSQVNTFSQK
jgi:general secretion pathway protein D